MQKKIIKLLIKFVSRINRNTSAALRDLRRHLYFMEFEERADDVYIVTFLKSGTTWMQVIVYNLLTDGNMDFEHIYDVSPWPSNQAFKGQNAEKINALPSPRILKFHDPYEEFDEQMKNKIIYVYRDGKDVAVSLYHHNKNYLNPDLTFDENFETHFTNFDKKLNYFKYNQAWFQNKNKFNILYVSYESLKQDFDQTLKKIAAFLNVQLTDEIIARTKKHASFEYMKAHETKFGEIAPKKELVYNEFIRKGETGEGKSYLSEEQLKIYNENFSKYLAVFNAKMGQ
jgi:hypothetical protein